MYCIVEGTTHDLPDVADFIRLLNNLKQNPAPILRKFFDPQREIFITRAPGRLDVMGGIADYSGSLVLEMPIREATLTAIQRASEKTIKIVSFAESGDDFLEFEMPLSHFQKNDNPIDYQAARAYFQNDPEKHWAAYAAGVFLVLMRECEIEFREGAKILISSQIPVGKGVSSSAALEVAVMQAVCAAFDISLESRETALLCQKVENLVVGAPCGVMDQMTVMCGEETRLTALLCQPAELQESIGIPRDISFWGIDSGVRHAVVGADYGSVRVGAFMGYRIIANLAEMKVKNTGIERIVEIEDARWLGYLSNVMPSEFEQNYSLQIPEKIRGFEFLARYQGTTDRVTRIDPEKIYSVRVPTAHAIYEHHRVRIFAELLKQPLSERSLKLLGELMFQSHASYAACGLCEPGTNLLVELVRQTGAVQGLYGAKITGGGSGGTVAILGKRNCESAVAGIAETYTQETGHTPYIFTGSSPGSATFGHLKLTES
jgi:galactokinase